MSAEFVPPYRGPEFSDWDNPLATDLRAKVYRFQASALVLAEYIRLTRTASARERFQFEQQLQLVSLCATLNELSDEEALVITVPGQRSSQSLAWLHRHFSPTDYVEEDEVRSTCGIPRHLFDEARTMPGSHNRIALDIRNPTDTDEVHALELDLNETGLTIVPARV